jgi:hypothetical protein
MVEKNAEDLFNELASQEPIRDTSDDDINNIAVNDNDRPLDDYERNSPNLTDLQALLKLLSPEFKNKIFNIFMQSRLSPEVFKPYLKLAINNEIRKQDPYGRLDVVGISMELYTAMTKALDGRHIIDILEAFGSKADNQELDALSKGMGMN